MIYLDTNVIAYAITNDDKYGKACKKILDDIEKQRLKAACSVLVLIEIINVLQKINRKLAKNKLDVKANIDAILSLPIVWFDISFFLIRKAAEYDYQINGADYIHLATMDINSIKTVISADSDIGKADFVKRQDPLDY